MTLHIGITATRDGITGSQGKTIIKILREYWATHGIENLVLHQGCCVGGDEQVTIMAAMIGMPIVAHPPTIKSYLSLLAVHLSTTIMQEYPYIERNHNIVDNSSVLIAAPKSLQNRNRAGTWITYNYAKENGVKTILVLPDGLVQ